MSTGLSELGRGAQRLNADLRQSLGADGIEELRSPLTQLLPVQDE